MKKKSNFGISGNVSFRKPVHSPWTISLTLEKFERNQWIVSFFSRYIPDFCLTLKAEHEPWYPVTKHLSHNCPFNAGVNFYCDNN